MRKQRKCKICKEKFDVKSNHHWYCDFECAMKGLEKEKQKKWKKEKKEIKEKLKTNSDYVRELQVVFNKFIRTRDKDKTCISCNNNLIGKYDAGHYYSTGSYPELRFNENNVFGQCVHCNQHKRGNIHEYRVRLGIRISLLEVKELESLKGIPRKYTIPELIELKAFYKLKTKKLNEV